MPPRRRGPFHRAQIAPLRRVNLKDLGPLCACGDAVGWHELMEDDSRGRCTYRPCGCRLFRPKGAPDVA
jgi:hypothetical protein